MTTQASPHRSVRRWTPAGLLPWTPDGDDAYIRLLLTRGVGELSYDPRRLQDADAGDHRAAASTAARARLRRRRERRDRADPAQRPEALNPLIKSNNLLNNALAMQRAIAQGGFEAVMRNHLGELAECSQSNLFVVRGGQVLTPPAAGRTARRASRGSSCSRCAPMIVSRLRNARCTMRSSSSADEAFLTSTTREIVPIVRVDGKAIGTGRPGPITARLREAFRVRVEASSRRPELQLGIRWALASKLKLWSPACCGRYDSCSAYSSTGGHTHIRLRSP